MKTIWIPPLSGARKEMSMSIYEIEQEILALVDPETGEITDFEALDALSLARDEKIENIALWIKNLNAEAKAIREEEKNLAERRHVCENKAESLRSYLDRVLSGEAFKTAKVAISYRKSTAVEVDEGFVEWAREHADNLLKFSEPSVDKTAVKEAIASGAEFEHARMVENLNIQIK